MSDLYDLPPEVDIAIARLGLTHDHAGEEACRVGCPVALETFLRTAVGRALEREKVEADRRWERLVHLERGGRDHVRKLGIALKGIRELWRDHVQHAPRCPLHRAAGPCNCVVGKRADEADAALASARVWLGGGRDGL